MKLPVWASIFTICGVCVLCTLGTWQVQRLAWKTELIGDLEHARSHYDHDVIDLSSPIVDSVVYGRLEGVLRADLAFLFGPPRREREWIGRDLVVPLETHSGVVLVNLGWTNHPVDEQPIHLGKVGFIGILRKPGSNFFTPQNDPANDMWYRMDTEEIAAAKKIENLADFVMYPDRASEKFDAAFPEQGRFILKNNHQQYAIFWFTMAGALIVVYILRFLWKT